MELKDLKHIEKKIPNTDNGEVFLLENGAIISAENEAMLQALHSRSVGGFKHHLKELEKKGSEKFMESFYIGYGHKSIGDCGSDTIFVEGVSMLVAKAIQDSKLYNGQEASTRYIDFSEQDFINPLKSENGKKVLEFQREFYLSLLEPLKNRLYQKFPIEKGQKEKIYKKAIAAKAFDIARGFLPAGSSTNLSWHSNLRQFSDKLLFLRHHPLKEVRNVANTIEDVLIEKYPSSFSKKRYEETEKYQDLIAQNYYYHNQKVTDFEVLRNIINQQKIDENYDLFEKRPPKTELPKYLSLIGELGFEFKLDFGSFRDLQRHRAIEQRMPLLTTDIGVNDFYIENSKRALYGLEKYLEILKKEIKNLDCSREVKQYYIPMGYNTSNLITGDLPSVIYMVELRSTSFVHPTLRKRAHQIGEYIKYKFGIPIYLDKSDGFNIKRGEHDIVRVG